MLRPGLFPGPDLGLGRPAAVPEPVGVVAGLDDVAVVRQPIQQRRGHLGVDEDVGPLGEHQVGRDHHAGVLVQLRQQVEQQRPAGLAEVVAQFDLDPIAPLAALKEMRARSKNPPLDPAEFAAAFERNGLVSMADRLREASDLI